MFKYRLLTTLILVPLVLSLLYWGNYQVISGLMYLIVLGLGYEWTALAGLTAPWQKLLFIIGLVITLYAVQFYLVIWLIIGIATWGLVFIFIQQYPNLVKLWGAPFLIAGAGLLLLPLFVQCLLQIIQFKAGKSLLLYLLALVWAADIGAYLSGKAFGRHKLIPAVSPGKSYEGIAGGLGCSLLIAWGSLYYFPLVNGLHWLMGAIIIYVISVIGDLFISMLKRRVNLKDTGKLLPGHGGLLDRLDSLIAAAPFFYCLLIAFFSEIK